MERDLLAPVVSSVVGAQRVMAQVEEWLSVLTEEWIQSMVYHWRHPRIVSLDHFVIDH